MDQIQREQWMTQVIEDAHEENQVELLAELRHVVNRELSKLDVRAKHFGGEARLCKIVFVEIDTDDAIGAAAFHLERVVARVATDIEHGAAGEIAGDCVLKCTKLGSR